MILKSREVRHGSTGIYIHRNVHLRYIVYCIKNNSSKKKSMGCSLKKKAN